MLETIAWLGTLFLASHALPQVYKTIAERDASGLSMGMLVLWWCGVVCTLPYVIQVQNWPVVAAHTINFFACSLLIYTKAKGVFKMKTMTVVVVPGSGHHKFSTFMETALHEVIGRYANDTTCSVMLNGEYMPMYSWDVILKNEDEVWLIGGHMAKPTEEKPTIMHLKNLHQKGIIE